eukprot:2107128-Prymnesium_polylepis.1
MSSAEEERGCGRCTREGIASGLHIRSCDACVMSQRGTGVQTRHHCREPAHSSCGGGGRTHDV